MTNPAGFTVGIADFGRSGELYERDVVAVGAGTAGLLTTWPGAVVVGLALLVVAVADVDVDGVEPAPNSLPA